MQRAGYVIVGKREAMSGYSIPDHPLITSLFPCTIP